MGRLCETSPSTTRWFGVDTLGHALYSSEVWDTHFIQLRRIGHAGSGRAAARTCLKCWIGVKIRAVETRYTKYALNKPLSETCKYPIIGQRRFVAFNRHSKSQDDGVQSEFLRNSMAAVRSGATSVLLRMCWTDLWTSIVHSLGVCVLHERQMIRSALRRNILSVLVLSCVRFQPGLDQITNLIRALGSLHPKIEPFETDCLYRPPKTPDISGDDTGPSFHR